jgi:hypothetical protein
MATGIFMTVFTALRRGHFYTGKQICSILGIKVKAEVLPKTGHEGPEGK